MRRFEVFLVLALTAGRAAAQPVGSEFRVNTWTTDEQKYPSIAGDASGNFVVVWQSAFQTNSLDVFGQRFTSSGAPRGAEFRVNTTTAANQRLASVAADAAGRFVVVWEGYAEDGDGIGIFAQRYASTGDPLGGEFRVNEFTSGAQRVPRVALDSSGGFVVVWASAAEDGEAYGVFARRYGSSGAPLGGEFRVNSYTSSVQQSPSVSLDAAGNFLVTWQSIGVDVVSFGIAAQRYAAGGAALGGEFVVNEFSLYDQRFPVSAFDAAGSFTVVWQSNPPDGDGDGIFARRYTSDGAPASGEFRVNTYTSGSQRYPRIVSDDGTGFLVVWQSESLDGFGRGIAGQRYDGAWNPKGAEFLINTYTTEQQDRPGVAADGAGGFVVAWESYTPDGSAWGIFAQRYCSPLATVSVSVNGSTSVCPTGSGGTATVTDDRGGVTTHQWAWRPTGGMAYASISGATGTNYLIQGADFSGGAVGSYELVCQTFPQCGSAITSAPVSVTVALDMTSPVVTAPTDSTVTQTLCQ